MIVNGIEADVRLAFEACRGQLRRQERLQFLGRDLPVQKEQVVPVLTHHHRQVRLQRRSNSIDIHVSRGRLKQISS